MLGMVVFGFQIAPGDDEEMVFAPTLEQCQQECLEHRADIRKNDPENYAAPDALGPMAVYRFVLRQLSVEDYLAVLNDEHHDLLKVACVDRRLVAVVVD